jgi:CheY-like chemotaxis protein
MTAQRSDGEALSGRRILVVEDEWLVADDISEALVRAGATVIGPVASVGEALRALAESSNPPDAATLNIRVADGESYPAAEALERLGIPFIFVSANSRSTLPMRFARRALVAKPISGHRVAEALAALLC